MEDSWFYFTWWGKSGAFGQLCMLYCIISSPLLKGVTGSIPKGSQGNTGKSKVGKILLAAGGFLAKFEV